MGFKVACFTLLSFLPTVHVVDWPTGCASVYRESIFISPGCFAPRQGTALHVRADRYGVFVYRSKPWK